MVNSNMKRHVKCTRFEGVEIRSSGACKHMNENVSSLIDAFSDDQSIQRARTIWIYTPTLTCQKVEDMDNMHKQKLAEKCKMEET